MQKQSGSWRTRIILGLVLLFVCLLVGGYASIHSPQLEVPQPWGSVRHLYFSTNKSGVVAHFRFKSNFPFAVFNEYAIETRTLTGWQTPRGAFAFKEITDELKAGEGQQFSVKIPKNSEAWRVVLRSTKSSVTPNEERRERLRAWLEEKGVTALADKLRLQEPGSYVTPGPEMQMGSAGQLARPR